MKCLVTGGAGFIGFHLSKHLLNLGYQVVGVDNLNDYYSPELKNNRLAQLQEYSNFVFEQLDFSNYDALTNCSATTDVELVVHLGAQAGVRSSITNPFDYVQSNLVGHAAVLEFCRHSPKCEQLIYASSSSVYGDNHVAPFSEDVNINQPRSLYAATKAADELMSASYASLYGLKQIGLRFFTVYGSWGRPDMAYWMFLERILRGEPIKVFNHGDMRRDFTYIDDIVTGVTAIIESGARFNDDDYPHRVLNIGNNKPVQLMDMISLMERIVGIEAKKEFLPMQPGDVYETCADIDAIRAEYGFQPRTSLEEGLPRFVEWFRQYHGI